MFVKAALFLAAAGVGQISIPLGKPPRIIEQPKFPIERYGPLWSEICEGAEDDWDKAAPPVRVHGNTYYVGTCGIASILIAGSDGHILIDGGTEQGAEAIAANIARLGFSMRDVKYILTSHEHFDHAGGIAALQQLSGATLVTSAPAARVFASGQPSKDDPQFGSIKGFPPVIAGRVVRDGDQVRLGNLMVEAIATPGHTAGAMSWRWMSCDGGSCRIIVYSDSMSPVSSDSYRFSDHPDVVAAFRSSFAKIAASPCEILLTPHPSASQLRDRFEKGEVLLDTEGCKTYAASREKMLGDRLAKEAEDKPKP